MSHGANTWSDRKPRTGQKPAHCRICLDISWVIRCGGDQLLYCEATQGPCGHKQQFPSPIGLPPHHILLDPSLEAEPLPSSHPRRRLALTRPGLLQSPQPTLMVLITEAWDTVLPSRSQLVFLGPNQCTLIYIPMYTAALPY